MIDLSDFEDGKRYKGRYRHDLKALQLRLEQIQVAHIVRNKAAVIMLEGWDAAGKGGIVERLVSKCDQRHYEVYPIAAPSPTEKAHDFLWRFQTRLPQPGNLAIFDRSWYGRVLVERVEGFATEEEWQRGYAEINAFENSLLDAGVTLVKLFVHVSQSVQDERLKARLQEPWKRWKTGLEDFRNRAKRPQYLDAMHDMFSHTDTADAPWFVVDGTHKKAARITALTYIADRLAAHVDMTPPTLDPDVAAAAEKAFG